MKEICSTGKFIKKIKQIKFKSTPGFNTDKKIKRRIHGEEKRNSYSTNGRQRDRSRSRNRRDHLDIRTGSRETDARNRIINQAQTRQDTRQRHLEIIKESDHHHSKETEKRQKITNHQTARDRVNHEKKNTRRNSDSRDILQRQNINNLQNIK
jgi:hypothetical protein